MDERVRRVRRNKRRRESAAKSRCYSLVIRHAPLGPRPIRRTMLPDHLLREVYRLVLLQLDLELIRISLAPTRLTLAVLLMPQSLIFS